MGLSRKNIARQSPFYGQEMRGTPAPCFSPDFTDDNELYEKFGGLNEIAIAQQDQQYKNIIGVRLQPIEAPTSIFEGCDDKTIADNILEKHVSLQDVYHHALYLQDELKQQNEND